MFLGLSESAAQLLVPWCTYTDPEVAHVGLYEAELDKRGVRYTSYRRELRDVDRCKCEGVTEGFVKIRSPSPPPARASVPAFACKRLRTPFSPVASRIELTPHSPLWFKSAREGSDEILGATIVGPSAGDMISEITLCMNNGIGLSKLAGCIHPYPTTAEAVRRRPNIREGFTGASSTPEGGTL